MHKGGQRNGTGKQNCSDGNYCRKQGFRGRVKYAFTRVWKLYCGKNLHIVSIALDAPNDTISALAGKIGNISGISVKTAYANA